jgi:hypothetical protein
VDEKKSSVPINETLTPRMESSGFGPRSIHLGPRIQWIPARSIHLAAGIQWILVRIQWIRIWNPLDFGFHHNAFGDNPVDSGFKMNASPAESTGFEKRNRLAEDQNEGSGE